MNLRKAWRTKLEAGIFWPSRNLYRQCDFTSRIFRYLFDIYFFDKGALEIDLVKDLETFV